ncbi:MAG: hypothetical protein OEL91_10375 [Burkholderiaceae bacterium]|nr:hypothetical protein [Burkholderiaceae bacterium]
MFKSGRHDDADGLRRRPREGSAFNGFSPSIAVTTPADAGHVFAALADGGRVQRPLAKTSRSPRFGVSTDRFGVG